MVPNLHQLMQFSMHPLTFHLHIGISGTVQTFHLHIGISGTVQGRVHAGKHGSKSERHIWAHPGPGDI